MLDVLGCPCQGRILQKRADPAHGGGTRFGFGLGSRHRWLWCLARPSPARRRGSASSSPPRPWRFSKPRPISWRRRPDTANGHSQTTLQQPIASSLGTWLPQARPFNPCWLRAASCFRRAPKRSLPAMHPRLGSPPSPTRINSSLPETCYSSPFSTFLAPFPNHLHLLTLKLSG